METLKQELIEVIRKGKRHENYDYIVKRTKVWRAIVSGKGLDEYYTQFNQRETKEQFDQRKRITQQITSSVCKNVRDIEFKVPRSNSITRVIATEAGNETDLNKFKEILNTFWGDSSLNDYMDIRWVELNDTDPNSFVVLEWQPFEEDEYAQPYPYEVKSEEAIYYEYENNMLQYLVAMDEDEFTIYGKNETIKLEKITDEETLKRINLEDGKEAEMSSMETGKTVLVIRIKDNYYELMQPVPHDLGYVPAYQPGYMRDLATDGHSFLPPWWAAESTLMNLIKSKSELDLTIALHVFPQKLQYRPKCNAKGCINGELTEGGICPVCKGSGWRGITSSQDSIDLPLPKSKDEMVDLEQIIHYVYPPVDLVTFMDGYVEKLSKRALQMVYNSEIYSREAIAETATGRNIDMQAVYDTLYPLVKAMAKDWEFMVSTIADITDLNIPTISFTFSKDFKLKSIDGYYADLSLANTAGASQYVKGAIEDDIARIVYAEDENAMAKYLTLKAFNPFPGDTPEAVAMKMTQSYVPEFYKVLYSTFGFIFDELDAENPGFYLMNRAKQRELLTKKVTSLIPEKKAPVFTFPVKEPVAPVDESEPEEVIEPEVE
jgi:hypothetical protein